MTGRVPLMAFQRDRIIPLPVLPVTEIVTSYYFRFSALDKPGVLSTVSGILENMASASRPFTRRDAKPTARSPS